MNYEFHVGDYVKTIGGFVGWISNIKDNNYIVITDENNNSCGYHLPQEDRYFVRIGTYDFTKKEKKEIAELEDIENIDVKDWLPVFVVHCIRDCIERMATGAPRCFTAYSSDYTTHTFDEYEAAMYLQDLIDEKFGNRRHHR